LERVAHIRQRFIDAAQDGNYVIDKTGVKTIEIIGANFVADQPTIFGKVNYDYVHREIAWYESQSLNVNDIPGKVPQIWQDVSTPDGEINSNYGWCIFSEENGYQYKNVFEELRESPNSRRAVMIYNRPSMHADYNRGGMSDFMCTNVVQYLVRDGNLIALVYMRSNDVVFGYKNDYAWQDHVFTMLAEDLHLPKGYMIWSVGSLHAYERHFGLLA
jgi:thymidylate synthase